MIQYEACDEITGICSNVLVQDNFGNYQVNLEQEEESCVLNLPTFEAVYTLDTSLYQQLNVQADSASTSAGCSFTWAFNIVGSSSLFEIFTEDQTLQQLTIHAPSTVGWPTTNDLLYNLEYMMISHETSET